MQEQQNTAWLLHSLLATFATIPAPWKSSDEFDVKGPNYFVANLSSLLWRLKESSLNYTTELLSLNVTRASYASCQPRLLMTKACQCNPSWNPQRVHCIACYSKKIKQILLTYVYTVEKRNLGHYSMKYNFRLLSTCKEPVCSGVHASQNNDI